MKDDFDIEAYLEEAVDGKGREQQQVKLFAHACYNYFNHLFRMIPIWARLIMDLVVSERGVVVELEIQFIVIGIETGIEIGEGEAEAESGGAAVVAVEDAVVASGEEVVVAAVAVTGIGTEGGIGMGTGTGTGTAEPMKMLRTESTMPRRLPRKRRRKGRRLLMT